MSEFKDLVYILRDSFDRPNYGRRNEGYDLQAFSFEKVLEVWDAIENKVLDLPEVVFFYKCHEESRYVKQLDSLTTLEICPIFSQKMIDVLLSVRDFKYKKYPIAVVESRNHNPYEEVEKYKNLSLRDDLFIFQTLESLDVFDWENSEYTQEEYDKEMNIPTFIDRFVLKTPENGFPPLFRIPFEITNLFISREAREALKVARIPGLSFVSLLRPKINGEVDNPIKDVMNAKLIREAEKHQKKVDKVFERAEKARSKGDHALADRLEQEAHDLMRTSG